MKEKRINKYYSTCYPSHIEIARRFKNENGDRNEYYIYDLLANYEREQEAEINQKNSLESDIHKRLKQENKLICMFFSDVFKLYDAVCDYKNTSNRNIINCINRCEFDVEQRLNDLDYHSLFIARLVEENRIKEAIEVKRFLDNNFKNLVNHFSSCLGIKLKESPLKRKVLSYCDSVSKSINHDEVKIISHFRDSNSEQNSGNDYVSESLITNEEKNLKSIIEDYYSFFLEEDNNKKLNRLSDLDFKNFVDWLVYFYENDCKVPDIDNPIEIINTNKGLVRFSLMDFYKNIMAQGNYCESLFQFYRSAFYPYRNEKTDTIKKNRVLPEYRKIVNRFI